MPGEKVGVAPFKDRPAHVYPYTEMGPEQRAFLRGIVQAHLDCSHGGEPGGEAGRVGTYINAASRQMGGGFVIEFQPSVGGPGDRAQRIQSHQRGEQAPPGGAQASAPRYLDAESVLKSMCRAVFMSRDHAEPWRCSPPPLPIGPRACPRPSESRRFLPDARRRGARRKHGVCSILIQRVSSAIHTSRGTLQRVGEEISRLEAAEAMLS